MQLSEIWAISGTILASIGGGTAIVFGFSSWLGKVWANRLMEKEKNEHSRELEFLRNKFYKETESYKIKLKKSELIFEKQFEAASELVALQRSFVPEINFPHMDWEDVLDHYACSSEKIEKALEEYLSRHGAILGEEVEEKIAECIGIAVWNKFEINKEYEVTSKGKKEGEKINELLNEAKTLMVEKVTSQTST
jgi:hypothetical protein